MSHETAAPERKHLRTLERRIAHLEGKLEERKAVEGVLQGASTFDAAELAALRVAHETMRLYRDTAREDAETTPGLLRRAADALAVWLEQDYGLDKDPDHLLVSELRERAGLLEQLEQ